MAAMREVLHLGKRVSRHTRKWDPEHMDKVRAHLRQQKVFVYTPGRKLPAGMRTDILEQGQVAAHNFLNNFLNNTLEPLSDADIEKLPDDRQLDESAVDDHDE